MDGLEAESTHLIETWTFRESGKPKIPSTSTNFKEIFQFLFPEKKWEDWPNIPFLEGLSDSPKDVGKHRRFFFFSKKQVFAAAAQGCTVAWMGWFGVVPLTADSPVKGPPKRYLPLSVRKVCLRPFFFGKAMVEKLLGSRSYGKQWKKRQRILQKSTWSVS